MRTPYTVDEVMKIINLFTEKEKSEIVTLLQPSVSLPTDDIKEISIQFAMFMIDEGYEDMGHGEYTKAYKKEDAEGKVSVYDIEEIYDKWIKDQSDLDSSITVNEALRSKVSTPAIDWDKLRQKFFDENVTKFNREALDNIQDDAYNKLFQWFKSNIPLVNERAILMKFCKEMFETMLVMTPMPEYETYIDDYLK